AVLAQAIAELRAVVVRAVTADGSYRERLDAVIAAMIELERAHRPVLGLVLRELIDPRPSEQTSSTQLAGEMAALVDILDRFVAEHGRDHVLPGLPVRATIVQLIVAHLARAAMGAAGASLWGGEHPERDTARISQLLLSYNEDAERTARSASIPRSSRS
ncbi:MAG: hypothetical protein AAGC55_32040, partial [Myxococcota bacterium]